VSYDFDNKLLSSSSPKLYRPFRVQTSILQPDISVIRVGTTEIDRLVPEENLTSESIPNIEQKQQEDNHIEQDWSADDQTFAECYEVTYQIGSQYPNTKEQIQSKDYYLEFINYLFLLDQSDIPIKIHLDPSEYKDLVSWLPVITQHEYEQIDRKHHRYNLEHEEIIPNEQDIIKRIKSHSVDDLSRTSNDQTSSIT
jgi:hypothetical protein